MGIEYLRKNILVRYDPFDLSQIEVWCCGQKRKVVSPANIGEYNHNVKKPIEELEKASQSKLLRLFAEESKKKLKRDLGAFRLSEEDHNECFEAYFGFTGTPFCRDIPIKELLETEALKELHGRLQYVVKTRAFGVFSGDAGTGKTTAIRKFSQGLDPNRYCILYISDSSLTPRNFYWETLYELGYKPHFYRGDAKRQFQKALANLVDNEKKCPVVIVDEAHLLSREMLEEIRFLLNLRMDSYSALSLILVGQSELRDTLKLQVNAAIAQRVDIRFHLTALNREETTTYINRHLTVVKAPGEIFTQAAIGVIHEYCGGIPRRINKVSTACLMTAPGQNQKLIDDHLVRVVIESEFEG